MSGVQLSDGVSRWFRPGLVVPAIPDVVGVQFGHGEYIICIVHAQCYTQKTQYSQQHPGTNTKSNTLYGAASDTKPKHTTTNPHRRSSSSKFSQIYAKSSQHTHCAACSDALSHP